MNDIVFSKHSLEQMQLRGITIELAQSILDSPQQVILEPDKKSINLLLTFKMKANI